MKMSPTGAGSGAVDLARPFLGAAERARVRGAWLGCQVQGLLCRRLAEPQHGVGAADRQQKNPARSETPRDLPEIHGQHLSNQEGSGHSTNTHEPKRSAWWKPGLKIGSTDQEQYCTGSVRSMR